MASLISILAMTFWMVGPEDASRRNDRRLSSFRFQVDINQAMSDELQAIPSIGPKLADRIVAYRTQQGRFSRIEDIRRVAGLGKNLYVQIEPYLTIDVQSNGVQSNGVQSNGFGQESVAIVKREQ